MMHGHEKSDSVIVAEKPANKAEQPAAEQSAAEPTAAESVEPGLTSSVHCMACWQGNRINGRRLGTARPFPLWRLPSGPQSSSVDPCSETPPEHGCQHAVRPRPPWGTLKIFLGAHLKYFAVCFVCHTLSVFW
jgi:hypothetical protein